MKTSDRVKQAVGLATLLLLAACNGGIGGTGGNDGGGGNKEAVSVGTVDATGSVTVNGVTFDTSAADITIDEASANEADLQQGMVVAVRGTIDAGGQTGTANTVVAEDVVKGTATYVDANNLTVMGQNVKVGVDTILDPVQALVDFNTELVEVSGYVTGPGVIHATRIEEKVALTTYKVTGFIDTVVGDEITIGGITIDTTGADLSGMEGQVLMAGQLVEVKANNAALTTPSISLFGRLGEDDGTEVELEGFVTAVTGMPVTSFMIGSQQVSISGSTEFDGGTIDDLIVGAHVEAEGMMSGGVLIADEIEFEENIELEANVLSVDGPAGTVTLSHLNIVVNTDLNTEIATKNALDEDSTLLTDLLTGEHVRIRGRLAGDGVTIVATRMEERSADTRIILQGPVTTVDAMAFTLSILSHPIATDGSEQYRGENEEILTRVQFFDALELGRLVKADGDENGMAIDWNELELEH